MWIVLFVLLLYHNVIVSQMCYFKLQSNKELVMLFFGHFAANHYMVALGSST